MNFKDELNELTKATAELNELSKITATTRDITTKPAREADPMMQACVAAADHVRDIHKKYEAEGEELAKHLEETGENLRRYFCDAAAKIRELRVVPQEMAEQTAADLMHIGTIETDRHHKVRSALLGARDALQILLSEGNEDEGA